MREELVASELPHETLIYNASRRARRPLFPSPSLNEIDKLKKVDYRLGVLKFDTSYVETIFFLYADGLELGYYIIHLDFDGCFVDFSSYDQETEVRAVYESHIGYDDGRSLTEVIEQDLYDMGYYIPELRKRLNDLRLTCESNSRCGSADCIMNCSLQEKFRPKR